MKKNSLFLSILCLLFANFAFAQAPEIKRTPLQTLPLSTPGKVAIQMIVDIPPGGVVPKHTHPGEEISYVMSGEIELNIDGQATKVVKVGEAFYAPDGVIHGGRNASSTPVKLLVTYVVEKDKPVATLVK